MKPIEIIYPSDCLRIQRVVLSHGHKITIPTSQAIWSDRSAAFCTTFLRLPTTDDDLWKFVAPYFEDQQVNTSEDHNNCKQTCDQVKS